MSAFDEYAGPVTCPKCDQFSCKCIRENPSREPEFNDDFQFKTPESDALDKRGYKRTNDPRDPIFTDEDLKRFKLLVGRSEESANIYLSKQTFDGLLSRLEAAEKAYLLFWGKSCSRDMTAEIREANEVWLKVSGK